MRSSLVLAVVWLVGSLARAQGAPVVVVAPDGVAGDRFGETVALWGDTLVVSAPRHQGASPARGAVYVFRHEDEGWTLSAELVVPLVPLSVNKGYGSSLAVHGDTLVIGYPNYRSSKGATYVHERGEGGPDSWGLTQILEDGGHWQGWDVACDGRTIGVTVPWDVGPYYGPGHRTLLLYERTSGSAWELVQSFGIGPFAGRTIALEGGRALAGTIGHERDLAAVSIYSSASSFRRTASGWVRDGNLEAVFRSTFSGRAVALSDPWAAVSEPERFPGRWEGRVTVRDGSSPVQVLRSTSADFGASLAMDGGLLAVGDAGTTDGVPGRVELWTLCGDRRWIRSGELSGGADVPDGFGASLGVHEGRVAVGAPEASVGGVTSGAVFVVGAR